ncbi:MAG: hypothetical protein AAF570_25790, partial [Bacteroidota bacterium]
RNEMALIDTHGGPTLYGDQGIAYIFKGKWSLVRALFAIPGFPQLFRFAYRTLAFNRFHIATPSTKVVPCDCAPERPAVYRGAYLAWSYFWAVLVTALFGAGLAAYFPEVSAAEGAIQMLLIAGTGWLLQLLIAALFLRNRRDDYPDHLATIMRKGVMVLLPATLLLLVFGPVPWWLPALSVLASSGLMLRQHVRRVRFLHLSTAWNWSWFLSLQTTAALWVLYFHIL